MTQEAVTEPDDEQFYGQPPQPAGWGGRPKRARAAAARFARRPGAVVPCAAALGAVVLTIWTTGRLSGIGLSAAGAALAAYAALARIRRGAGSTGLRLGPDLNSMEAALSAVTAILDYLHPGPEAITAADPAAVQVAWDMQGPGSGSLPPGRADKMLIICALVRQRAHEAGLLHQLPQILLVASDDAAVELFGSPAGQGRTGRALWPEA